MTRLEKQDFVDQFSKTCKVVVRQVGLSADAVMQLRRNARAEGILFQVIKNRLAKLTFQGESKAIAGQFVDMSKSFFPRIL